VCCDCQRAFPVCPICNGSYLPQDDFLLAGLGKIHDPQNTKYKIKYMSGELQNTKYKIKYMSGELQNTKYKIL